MKKKIYRGKLTKAVTTLHFRMAYHVDLKNIQAWPQCHEEWYRNLSDGLEFRGEGGGMGTAIYELYRYVLL